MGHLGELEQLILFAVTALGDEAYGGAIRAHIEERSGRIVSSGAINTTLGRLASVAWWSGASARPCLDAPVARGSTTP